MKSLNLVFCACLLLRASWRLLSERKFLSAPSWFLWGLLPAAFFSVSVQAAEIPQRAWKLLYVDSQEITRGNAAAVKAFDGKPETYWHTQWFAADPPHPHEIRIDLGDVYNIEGFHYLPRQDRSSKGTIKGYSFFVSADGSEWGQPTAQGEFPRDTTEKVVRFNKIMGRYVRLVAHSEIQGLPSTSVAELKVLGTPYVNSLGNSIVFHKNFNSDPIETYSAQSITKQWNTSKVTTAAPDDARMLSRAAIIADTDGNRVLKVKLEKGGTLLSGSGIQWIPRFAGADEYYFSLKIKFNPDFNFVKGGTLPGFLGGNFRSCQKPNGADFLSMRAFFQSGGNLVTGVYHLDNPESCGENLGWTHNAKAGERLTAKPGQWHILEGRVKLNSVINGTAHADGVVEAWMDGTLVARRSDYRFRHTTALKIDKFLFLTYFGGADPRVYAPNKEEYVYFDDLIIATRPLTHRTGNVVEQPRNQAPTLARAELSTVQNTESVPVTPVVNDPNAGDTHTYTLVAAPSHGTTKIINNKLVYIPQNNYLGEDRFTFRATDSGGLSVVGEATVLVKHRAPTSTSAKFSVTPATTVRVKPTVVDPDIGDTHTFKIITQPEKGEAQTAGAELIYIARADYAGSDSFKFRATDSGGLSVEGVAAVSMGNRAPTLAAASLATQKNKESTPVVPTVHDPDNGDVHAIALVTQAIHGQARVVNNALIYTPNRDFSGSDTFTFRATDRGGLSVTGTAQVMVADAGGTVETVDIVVAVSGKDAATCGSQSAPCRTLKYAVEKRARDGMTVGVLDGIYDEVGAISVPKGVSITGVSQDATKVIVRPNFAMASRDFFIYFVDANPDQLGNQSLAYLTLDARALNHKGWRAVEVRNRHNVRIHHMRFIFWDQANDAGDALALEVGASRNLAPHAHKWWLVAPSDAGPAGDYSNWTDWPKYPVKNFEFDHNYVYRCGGRSVGQERPGKAVKTFNLKDSSFHHNEFDLRGTYAQAMYSIAAYHDNVDLYENIFRATNTKLEKMPGAQAKSDSMYVLETWLHIRGSQWYNNVSNASFSIAFNKDVEIRDNIILRNNFGTRIAGIGIETGFFCHSSLHHNYIFGGERGSSTTERGDAEAFNCGNRRFYENIFLENSQWPWSFNATGTRDAPCGTVDKTVNGVYFHNNVVDKPGYGGVQISKACKETPALKNVLVSNNLFLNGGARPMLRVELAAGSTNVSLLARNNLRSGYPQEFVCKCVGETGVCPATPVCEGVQVSDTLSADPQLETGNEIIIVNNGGSGTSMRGTWQSALIAAGHNALGNLHAYNNDAVLHAAGAGDWYQFEATGLEKQRPTLVALSWPRNFAASRSSKVPVEIYDGDSATPVDTLYIDQASWDSSGWYYLGKYVFSSGKSRIRVLSSAAGEVVADAVLWSKLGAGYKIRSDSPAVDAGATTEGIVDKDFFGNPIPLRLPDIGIHER